MSLKWITSYGGPLLLLSAKDLRAWEGAVEPSGGRVVEAESRWNIEPDAPATDYDRACDVVEHVGVLSVGAGHGLVFPDKMTTTWWLQSPSSGVVIRGYTEHPDLLRTVAAVPEQAWEEELFTFQVGTGPLCLFDSALPGDAALSGPHLAIHLSPGEYRVETHILTSAEFGWNPLHRLTRAQRG